MARHTAKSHKIRKVEILVIQTSNFIQNSRRDKNLITAAVLLIVNPASAGYTIDIPKGTPQTNNSKQ